MRDAQVSGRVIGGVLTGLAGVVLTVGGGISGGHATLFGALILLAASLGYAVGTSIAKRTLGGLNPVGLATTQLTLSSLMLAPVALLGPQPGPVTASALGSMLVLGVFGSGIAYLLFYGLLARISPTQVSAVTYLLPLWGLFWGAVAGEEVGVLSLLGVAVVLSGLLLLNMPRRDPGTQQGSSTLQAPTRPTLNPEQRRKQA